MSRWRIFIRKLLPVDKFFFYRSYSQEGEDMVLRGFFEDKKNYKGFYVDVGAHHPYRYSNTMYFYRKGWRGINIEPTPTAIKWFNIFRKKDINLNIGISESRQKLNFFCFNEPALNGFSAQISEKRHNDSNTYKIIESVEVETWPLSEVLDKFLPAGRNIDFLSIDAEGLDYQILLSNDWKKYKPSFILVEDDLDFDQPQLSATTDFLKRQGYTFVAKTGRTLFFKYND